MRWIAAAAAVLTVAACTGLGEDEDGGDQTGSGDTMGTGAFNPTSGSGGSSENSCGTLAFEPQLIGVDMIISVDRSGSMSNDQKWEQTEAAFNTFFTSAEADNLSVALRFWPEDQCNDIACNQDACATPNVMLGPLSDAGHEQALIDAFAARNPTGFTPMSAALGGATQWALAQQQSSEVGKRVVVVFMTDGEPNGCDETTNGITQHAANALAQEDILTFAIGLEGSEPALMNAIATAGGTGPNAFYIGSQGGEQQLLQALKDIQEVAVACTFALPQSPDPTKELDPFAVDISYDAGDGSPPSEVPQVADAEACGAEGGWYYDDPQDPSVIFLCESTCEMVNDVDKPNGKLALEAGCRLIAE